MVIAFRVLVAVVLVGSVWGCRTAPVSPPKSTTSQAREDDQPPPPRSSLAGRVATTLPVVDVRVDAKADQGPLEAWRESVGHGGINSSPLPPRVVEGLGKLRPRLMRIFIQQFFDVYPEHGRFDWSRLDAYMDAMAKTGSKVVAAITIKPKPIFPSVDQNVWRPADVAEWQRVVAAMVKRYSVERPIVTHWEIGNETDIGENGGCPYLIQDPKDYAEFYKMTVPAILEAFPGAKVGGSGVANSGSDYLPKFIQQCHDEGIRLDFVSWHLYSDSPGAHAGLVEKYRKLVDEFPQDKRPEMMVTEWSKNFDRVSVEDMAFDPRRAAVAAACLIAYVDAKVDWTFYYHAWDQVAYLDQFRPFFERPEIMYHHWNEVPHRFGLFGVEGRVRPQYFVFQLLGRLGDRRLEASATEKGVRVLAGRQGELPAVMIVNGGPEVVSDRIVRVRFSNLAPGRRRLVVRRIDRDMAWSARELELQPVERREVDVAETFTFEVYCPADSVCMVALEDVK
jgi:hypothetical protein